MLAQEYIATLLQAGLLALPVSLCQTVLAHHVASFYSFYITPNRTLYRQHNTKNFILQESQLFTAVVVRLKDGMV